MIKLHAQQGDCILEIVSEIPKTAKRVEVGETFVVLKGEGVNTHEIIDTRGLTVSEENGVLFLTADREKEIAHQEHTKLGKQTILEPYKIYRRRIEREFSYEEMEARNTKD